MTFNMVEQSFLNFDKIFLRILKITDFMDTTDRNSVEDFCHPPGAV